MSGPSEPLVQPLVAVVIPALNEAGKIGRVLDRFPRDGRFEAIVVDDGSSDGTGDEARAHGADLVIRHVTDGDGEAVGRDVVGAVRLGDLAEIGELEIGVRQLALWAAIDRQVLDRLGMAIFEAADDDAAHLELPASADDLQCVGRGPAVFVEAIEGEVALFAAGQVGEFFDFEVCRFLLDVHTTYNFLTRAVVMVRRKQIRGYVFIFANTRLSFIVGIELWNNYRVINI